MSRIYFRTFAALAAVLVFSWIAQAQTTYRWTGLASGNWDVAANWATPTPAGGDATGILNFYSSANTAITATNNQGNPFDINRIDFNTYTANAFTVTNAASNTIRFNGANAGINNNGNGPVGYTGTMTLNANLNISGTGVNFLTLGTGVFSQTGGARSITISRAGAPLAYTGMVILNQSTPTITGGFILDGGTIQTTTSSQANPFGSGALTVTSNGGTWVMSTGSTYATGNITLNAGGTLRLAGGSTYTFSNASAFVGEGNLALRGAGQLNLNGNSTFNGTFISDISPYAQITSAPGTVTLASNTSGSAGALTSVSAIEIRSGGTMAVSNNAAGTTANPDRVNDAASVALRNGTFALTGDLTGGSLTEAIGALTISGYSTITSTVGSIAGPTNVNALSVSRNTDRGTALIRGTSLGTSGNVGFVTFNTPPTLSGVGVTAGSSNLGILPWVVSDSTAGGSGVGFATYGIGGIGVRPLNTTTEVVTTFTGTDNNVRLTAATSNAGTVTVNSLTITSTGSVTGTGTINVTSGGIINLSTGSVSNNLAFGSIEGIYHAIGSSTISGNLSGTGGFTKSGTGTLTLSGTNTGLSGVLTVNAGILSFASAANLPGDSSITVGATSATSGAAAVALTYTGSTALNISRNIQITNGWLGLNNTSTGALTLSGTISGNGGITYNVSGGTLILSGNNVYKGPTQVWNGTIRINGDAALGDPASNAGFTWGNGSTLTLALDNNWTTNRPLNIACSASGTVTFDTGVFNATWNGPLTNYTVAAGLTTTTTVVPLTKAGAGSLNVNGAGTFSQGLVISGGGVVFGQNGAWNSPTFTLAAGTRLTLDNTAVPTGTLSGAVVLNRVRDDATLALNGTATLRVIGNSLQQTTELMGATTSTNAGNIIQVEATGGFESILRISNLIATNALVVRGTDLGFASTGSVARVFLTQFNGVAVTDNQLLSGVTWENMNNAGTFVQAQYSLTRGIIAFAPIIVTGTVINNFAPDNTPVTAAYTTTNDATAVTGVQIYSLTLDGGTTLTLTGGNAASATNNNTPDGTLSISGGILNNITGPKTITSAIARTIALGNAAASMTIDQNLTSDANVAFTGTGGLTKTGTGTLTVNGPFTVTGPFAVNNGTIAFGAAATVGDLSGSGTVTSSNALTINAAGPSTFSGSLILSGAATLTKSGVGVFTLSPTNIPTYTGGTIIANGTLKLGNANAAAAVLSNVVTFGSASNTSGTIDLNGFSPPAALTTVNLVGTGTGHLVMNTNLTTQSTVDLNLPVSVSVPMAFSGNLIVNKNDANVLTLVGTNVGTPAIPGGNFKVNAGTLQLNAGSQGIGLGMSVSVANGATFRLNGASTNNSSNFWVNVSVANGGTFISNGTSYFDTYIGSYTLEGGSTVSSIAPGIGAFFHLISYTYLGNTFNPSITTTAGSTTINFSSTNTSDQIQNDASVPLVIDVAQGTTPSGIDVNFAIKFNSGTTTTVTKTGPGTMALSGNASASSYAFVVNAGRLMANTTSTGTGAITVNNTGTLAGNGTVGSTIVLNTGGKITGGNGTTGTLAIASVTFNPGSVIGGTITDGTVPSSGIPGSSTVGTLPGPSSNTFLNKTGGTAIGLSDVNVNFDISGTTFTLGSPYSYTIGQGFGDQSALNITDPARFQWGFFPGLVTSPSLTGDAAGFLYLNFTPAVPEPSLLIGLGLLTGFGIRRRMAQA